MDLETYDRLEEARVEQLIAAIDFEYPEDVPEMELMTAWGARTFRIQREEFLTECAWDLAEFSEYTLSELAKELRDRWLSSWERRTWSHGHQSDKIRGYGVCPEERAAHEIDH